MPLPDFRINPYVTPVTQGPSQEFGQAIDQRIADFDANAEFSDVLSYQTDTLLQNVAPFEGDQMYAKQIMNNTRKNIDQWAQAGDYENMGREIKRGVRQFAGEIAPLTENKARLSTYLGGLDEQLKAGKIGLDTYTKAKAASLSNYKGIDPNNVQGTMFSGFNPTDDVNITEKVDKFLEGWKANGGSKLIMNPDDGSYREIKWENASEKEIAQAAQEALLGDSEFTSYAQTQGTIGNQDRITQEFGNAVNAGVRKYGFYKEDQSIGWMPEYAFDNKKSLEIAQSLPSVPSSATTNPGAVDIFEARGLEIDEATGKPIMSSMVEKQNGKLYKFVDPQGNTISRDIYNEGLNKDALANSPEFGTIQTNSGFKKVEITPDEAAKFSQEADTALVDMAAQRFLREAVDSGKLGAETLSTNDEFTKEFLRINAPRYTNPKYLAETGKQYKEAIKNSQIIHGNKRWDISRIPGASTPEFTMLKEDDILANLTGQEVGILHTDIEGYRDGQKADLNSMLDKLQEDGYSIKSGRRLGPLQYNPFSNKPGMSYAITLENADKKVKTIEVAAATDDQELQPVQDIYNMFYKGMAGTVPFSRGKLRLRNTTVKDTDGKYKFRGFVEVLDHEGRKLNIPGFPQDITTEDFGDVYKQVFAPAVLNKYMNPKYRK